MARGEWEPYRGTWSETPCLGGVRKALPAWHRFRNALVRNPLAIYRLPSIPWVKSAPSWLKAVHHCLTLGETLVLLSVIALTTYYCVYGVYLPFPDAKSNGVRASWVAFPLIILATRNSVLTFLLGIPYERQLFWHKFTGGVLLMALAWVHSIRALYRTDAWGEELAEAGEVYRKGMMRSGIALAAFYTALPLASLSFFRRRHFNTFYIVHLLLFVGVLISSWFHRAYHIFYVLPLWLFDVVFRFVYLSLICAPRYATATRLPANVIRLTFKRDELEFAAGQYLFLMVPELGLLDWHPFSISSAPHEDTVSVHVRVLGDWTIRLHYLVGQKQKGDGEPVRLRTYWEGPYGAPHVDIENPKYKMFLLISGGIGVTPMLSIAKALEHQAKKEGRPLKKIMVLWSVSDAHMLEAKFAHDADWWDAGSGRRPPPLPISFQPQVELDDAASDAGISSIRTDSAAGNSGQSSGLSVTPTPSSGGSSAQPPSSGYKSSQDDLVSRKSSRDAPAIRAKTQLPLEINVESIERDAVVEVEGPDSWTDVSSSSSARTSPDAPETSAPELADVKVEVEPEQGAQMQSAEMQTEGRRGAWRARAGELRGSGLVHRRFHLTRVRTEAELEAANVRPEYQPWLRLGRPDLNAVFQEFAEYARKNGETRVATLACGPKMLVDDVRIFAGRRQGKDKSVRFDFHSEVFEF